MFLLLSVEENKPNKSIKKTSKQKLVSHRTLTPIVLTID